MLENIKIKDIPLHKSEVLYSDLIERTEINYRKPVLSMLKLSEKMQNILFNYLEISSFNEVKYQYSESEIENRQYYNMDGEPTKFDYQMIVLGTSQIGNCVEFYISGTLEFTLHKKSDCELYETKNYQLNIPEYIKTKIDHFLNEDSYEKYNINLNKGLLLHGVPGNGKTNILRYIRSLYPKDSIIIDNDQIPRIRSYERYKYQLFDDIDLKIFEPGHPLYNSMLTSLDSCSQKKFVRVFASNENPENISKAMLRPGRINLSLEIKNPLREDRLAYFLPLSKHNISSESINKIVDKTEDFSFAEINFYLMCLVDTDFNLEKASNLFENRILIEKQQKKVGFV